MTTKPRNPVLPPNTMPRPTPHAAPPGANPGNSPAPAPAPSDDPLVRQAPSRPHPADATDTSRSVGPPRHAASPGDPGALTESAASIIGDHLRGIKRALGDAAAAWDAGPGRHILRFLYEGLGPNNGPDTDFHRGMRANVEHPMPVQSFPPPEDPVRGSPPVHEQP